MGDFLTRLAERTLGVAPVVQPLIASVFAPGPAGPLDLEWDGEATTSSSDPDRAQTPSAEETPPARDTPTGHPEDAAIARQEEDRSDVAPTAPGRPQGTADTRPGPHHTAEPGPTRHDEAVSTSRRALSEDLPFDPRPAEGVPDRAIPRPIGAHVEHGQGTSPVPSPSTSEATSNRPVPPGAPSAEETPPAWDTPTGHPEDAAIARQEDRSDVAPAAPKHTQRTPDTRPEPHHPAGPAPARRDEIVPASHGAMPEDLPSGPPSAEGFSDRTTSRPIRTLVDHVQSATLPPAPGPEATLDRSESPAAAPQVAPRIVRPRLDAHVERGPREPRVAAPESSTIRVAIGRIEVRAITPPPPMPPAQRTTPARSGPALSLDDYLKQRNGGRR